MIVIVMVDMSQQRNARTSVVRDCLHSEMARRRNEVLIQWTESSFKVETNQAELFIF